MSENKSLAVPQSRELDVIDQYYDFEVGDYGNVPPYTKEDIAGKVLFVYGVSASSFDNGQYGRAARSLLHKLPGEAAEVAPFGLLLSEDSPAIQQAEEQEKNGHVPFVARLVLKESKAHKGQTYWTLEKTGRLQYDTNGQLIDPNA